MALQDILQRVQKAAQEQAAQINKEFEHEAAELKKEHKTRLSKEKKELGQRKDAAIEKLHAEAESMARRQTAQAEISAKKQVVSKSAQKLVDYLNNLDEVQYKKFVTPLFESVKNLTGTILVPASRVKVSESLCGKNLKVESHDDVAGGFIVQAGAMEIDYQFSNLIQSEFSNEIESFFAKELQLV